MTNNDFIVITDELISQTHNQMLDLIDISTVARNLGQDEEHMRFIFGLVKDESKQTLRLLKGLQISPDARILEVGAGYGLASICLALMGFSVTALEPGGIGFSDYLSASISFAEMCKIEMTHLDSTAEDADFATIEKFDVIVSNNVLEHINQLDNALSNLNNALAQDGFMIHSCANYSFPYEPHYGVPLLPFIPRLTSFFLPKRIKNDGVWKSLNFITASRVRKNVERNEMYVSFRKGTMLSSIYRLRNEEIFAARHKALSKVFTNNFFFFKVVKVFDLPISLATPMDFFVCHPGQQNSVNHDIWKSALRT